MVNQLEITNARNWFFKLNFRGTKLIEFDFIIIFKFIKLIFSDKISIS